MDRAGSCSPSQGIGAKRMKPVIRKVRRKKSVSGGIHCSWGGRLGRLFRASNNTASGSHCCGVKGTNWRGGGGHMGEGTNSAQWSGGDKIPCLSSSGQSVGGLYGCFPTALLTIKVGKCDRGLFWTHTFWSCWVTRVGAL